VAGLSQHPIAVMRLTAGAVLPARNPICRPLSPEVMPYTWNPTSILNCCRRLGTYVKKPFEAAGKEPRSCTFYLHPIAL